MTPRLQLASILLLAFFSISSCNRPDDGIVRGRKAVKAQMDSVELVIDDNPAYANSLMHSIDPGSIKNKKLRARYALLFTAAEYKNYQPFTSDSLIMEAVRYYSIAKNIDYRFLSYYYLGCVYMELNRIVDASVAFAQAEQLVDDVDNDLWKGLLYARYGELLYNSCCFKQAEEYYYKAIDCYELAEIDSRKMYALLFVGVCEFKMNHFNEADSILSYIQKWSSVNYDSLLYYSAINSRFENYVLSENIDSAIVLYKYNSSEFDEVSNRSSIFKGLMAVYYNQIQDYSKSELFLNKSKEHIVTLADSVYWFYSNYLIAKRQGDNKQALYYLNKTVDLDNNSIIDILMKSALGAQKDYYQKLAEIESVKAHNRLFVLVSSFMIFALTLSIIILLSVKRKRDSEKQKIDLISTVNDLTTQISVNQDRLSTLNGKVREMLRQQFNSSDYLYTRYYEQIDDNKKAERLYRVIKNQMEGFTNQKNLSRIDEMLNEAFDGIMDKISSSYLDLKEKDLLLLRFALAGFSAKSIAALLDDSHLNINQRKKRMLDKIQIKDPNLMDELRMALNIRQVSTIG